jgi:glycine/D-amino acid oxidase-like deaminating enzyme
MMTGQLSSPADESAVIRIVGQGLAGSTLALRLHDLGYQVRIYDNGYRTSSSRVAAGMWNPLSFVNLKRSWLAHELMPVMEKTYLNLERKLNCSFFHPMPMLRIFPDAGAANLWEEKSSHPEVASFIENKSLTDSESHYSQPFGSGVVKGAGWLDLPVYLDAARSFFLAHQVFEEREVSTENILDWLQEGDFVIQCTGWKPMQRSLWENLPIQTNKGQVLTVKADALTSAYMSNFGKFMIPLGNGLFRSGSTHEHGALDALPSDVAVEIEDDIRKSMKHPFSVIDHGAGFRPTTRDRQPVVGMHDVHNRLGVLNGLGSRGVMLVPLFTEHLIEHLMHGTPIMTEVHWRRFEERRLRRM